MQPALVAYTNSTPDIVLCIPFVLGCQFLVINRRVPTKRLRHGAALTNTVPTRGTGEPSISALSDINENLDEKVGIRTQELKAILYTPLSAALESIR
jgi:hypothetical protein